MAPAPAAFAGLWTSLPTPLTEWVLEVIRSLGYNQMTPVQASTIPLFMQNKDVVVEAVTGSGKTLAFVIPVIERLLRRETRLRKDQVGALIISPTRELASQIHSVFSLFLASQPGANDPESSIEQYPSPLLLISSDKSTPADDIRRFIETGADIIIGTPGRIEEFLLGKGGDYVNVKELEVLVLDEADRLLDLGFQNSLTKIITHLPKQRRTGLFSATMTDADALSELVRVGLRNPSRIIVKVQSKKKKGNASTEREVIEDRRIPANLQSYFIACRESEKVVQLSRIISLEMSERKATRFIVYFATCACVDYFRKILPSLVPNTTFYSLHGNLAPSARSRTLEAFATAIPAPSSSLILLATDVAARGLDLPNVDSIIQFDPPTDTKAFSHRCGRTARAGRVGTAWVLLCGREVDLQHFLSVRKIPMAEKQYLDSGTSSIGEERPRDPQVDAFLTTIRDIAKSDRAIHDKAVKAFVSFVRAYSKHEASYIFRVKDLDLIGVAKSFGLLRLPRMPELKTLDRQDWKDAEIAWTTFSYSDKAQEAKRVAAAAEEKAKTRKTRAPKPVAWSAQEDRKQEKQKRREKKKSKKEWLKTQAATTEESIPKRPIDEVHTDGGDDDDDGADDWKEYTREERMAKRVRKGDVDQDMFDAEFGYDMK